MAETKMYKHSLKHQIVFLITVGLVSLIGLLVFSNLYAISDSNKKIALSNERTLDYSVSQIENGLTNVDEMMLSQMISTNFQTLSAGASPLNAHLSSQEIVTILREYLRIYNFCDAFFIYSAPSKQYRDTFTSDYSYGKKQVIERWMESAAAEDRFHYSDGWMTRMIGGEYYLIRFYGGRGTYLIALTSFKTMAQKRVDADSLSDVTFCTSDGTETIGRYPDIDFQAALSSNGYILDGDPRRMILHKNIASTDVSLLLMVGETEYFSRLSNMQVFLVCLSLLSILLIPLTLGWIRRSDIKPLDDLEKTIAEIRAGHMDAKAPSSDILEFQDVGTMFNEMMQQISDLRIETYEKELATQRAELQYLQLQIRPHFYLNCLKGLYAVAQQKDVEKVQKIILSISGHLRYMFRDQLELVPLSQEIEHIRNYIEIQRLSSAYPPECRIDVPKALEGFLIPPLSLSTFVENSFKHRCGGQTVIHVKAAQLDNGVDRFLDLTVQDNGEGFSEQVLADLNIDDQKVYATDHVGIRNIRQRFRLIYGTKVMFAFYNTPQGPVSEIVIPLAPHKKEENHDGTDR